MTTKKLLIVDDHTGVSGVIRATAETLGFECRTVSHPQEALAAFQSFQPDVLLLDMMMPEKDGIDVLEEILRTDIDTKFILISGYGDGFLRLGERLVRSVRNVPVSFLKKPFRRDELVAALTEA